MAMINKNAKQPMESKAGSMHPSGGPMGGTGRTSFTGSSDPRKSGNVGNNNMLKNAPGLISQGPDTMDTSGDAREFVSGGPKSGGNMGGKVTVAKEDVTKGMGGKVIKDMR